MSGTVLNSNGNGNLPASGSVSVVKEADSSIEAEAPPVALQLPPESDVERSPGSTPAYRLRLTQQQVHFVSYITNEEGEKEQEGVVQAGSAARTFILQLQVLDSDSQPTAAFDHVPFKAKLLFEHDLSLVPSGDPSSGSLGGKTEVWPIRGTLTFVLGVLNLGRRVKKAGRRNQRFRISIEATDELLKKHPDLKLYTLPFATHSRVLNLVRKGREDDAATSGKHSGTYPSATSPYSTSVGEPPMKKIRVIPAGRPTPVIVPPQRTQVFGASPGQLSPYNLYSPAPTPIAYALPPRQSPGTHPYAFPSAVSPGYMHGYPPGYSRSPSMVPPSANASPSLAVSPAMPVPVGAMSPPVLSQYAPPSPAYPSFSSQQDQRDDEYRCVVRQCMALNEKYDALQEQHRATQNHATDTVWKLQQLGQEHATETERNRHLAQVVAHLEAKLAAVTQELETSCPSGSTARPTPFPEAATNATDAATAPAVAPGDVGAPPSSTILSPADRPSAPATALAGGPATTVPVTVAAPLPRRNSK
mmetsp:Transcript_8992/g.20654  ORF Transcript_8992/g.20654 Transcript_8992/m.20654 type:complete len:530 (+) Transcript_8992:90-1679(+)